MSDLQPMMPVVGVIGVEYPEQVDASLADWRAKADDAYWESVVHGALPFSWQLYTEWWVARRWITPRDPRKEEYAYAY